MTQAIIKAEQLCFSYENEKTLNSINFAVHAGDFLCVLGPNGSGKSTLLKLIAGFLAPTEGKALISGEPSFLTAKTKIAKQLAYVPSEIYLPYDFSVFDIVLMGRSPHLPWWRNYAESDCAIARQALAETGIEAFAGRSINSLSSGERQLVFIAQALAQKPQILLLDEPTSHLDLKYKALIFELLKSQADTGTMGVIVVSHDLQLASAYARQILLLKKGAQAYFGNAGGGLAAPIIADAYELPDSSMAAKFL